MLTCFLFAQQLDDEQGLCLRLDEDGHVDAPLLLRPIQEIRSLQQDARTVVIIPAESSSLYEVELPWLGEHKARAAIPYALEEQLAQNVTTLHFAFDRQHYQNNRYLVAVVDKPFLVALMAKLNALDLDFNSMTLDWFALKENEACATEHGFLIHDGLYKGALSGELASIYLKNSERQAELLTFNDSIPVDKDLSCTSIDGLSLVWLAQRLLHMPMMNLCQGELQHDTRKQTSLFWYRACAGVIGVWFVSVLLLNALHLHALTKKNVALDQKIAVIYREFFPEARQVISPKFRISQLLGQGSSRHSSLWFLLHKLALAFKEGQFTIEQLRFQNQILSVTLTSKNFAELEQLQQRLQQEKVKVTQAQASSHKRKVNATLELSL